MIPPAHSPALAVIGPVIDSHHNVSNFSLTAPAILNAISPLGIRKVQDCIPDGVKVTCTSTICPAAQAQKNTPDPSVAIGHHGIDSTRFCQGSVGQDCCIVQRSSEQIVSGIEVAPPALPYLQGCPAIGIGLFGHIDSQGHLDEIRGVSNELPVYPRDFSIPKDLVFRRKFLDISWVVQLLDSSCFFLGEDEDHTPFFYPPQQTLQHGNGRHRHDDNEWCYRGSRRPHHHHPYNFATVVWHVEKFIEGLREPVKMFDSGKLVRAHNPSKQPTGKILGGTQQGTEERYRLVLQTRSWLIRKSGEVFEVHSSPDTQSVAQIDADLSEAAEISGPVEPSTARAQITPPQPESVDSAFPLSQIPVQFSQVVTTSQDTLSSAQILGHDFDSACVIIFGKIPSLRFGVVKNCQLQFGHDCRLHTSKDSQTRLLWDRGKTPSTPRVGG